MNRQQLTTETASLLRSLPFVRAAWFGGSDASGRTDEHSDVDAVVIAEDDRVDDVFAAADAAFAGRIAHRYRVVPPPLGQAQVFYRFHDSSPHTLLDLFVVRASSEDRLLERERHGEPAVIVDRDGIAIATPLDRVAHDARMATRRADLVARFPIFQSFVVKAIDRGLPTEAMQFYRGMTLIPLVELLRMAHCPERFDFGLRYLDRDLPPDLAEAIDRLSFVTDLPTLRAHHAEAVAMFRQAEAATTAGDAEGDPTGSA